MSAKNCVVAVYRNNQSPIVVPADNFLSKKDAQREASVALRDPEVVRAVVMQSVMELGNASM